MVNREVSEAMVLMEGEVAMAVMVDRVVCLAHFSSQDLILNPM